MAVPSPHTGPVSKTPDRSERSLIMSLSQLANLNIGDFSLGKLLSAAVTLVICLLVIHFLNRLLRRLLAGTRLDARVQKYLLTGLKLLLYLVATLIVVDSLGIPITSLVALLSVGGLAVSLATEDILANVAGGLVLLSSRPFSIGDLIETDSVTGTVDEITLNYTKVLTFDGLTVLIPNKAVSSGKLTNYTTLGRRRVVWKMSASYDAPTETVKAACMTAMERTPLVLSDPAPAVYLTGYASSAIEYSVYCWAKTEDYWTVYVTLGENLRTAFAEQNVEITYDHLNVHLMEK